MALERKDIDKTSGDLFGGIKQSAQEARPEIDGLKQSVNESADAMHGAKKEANKETFKTLKKSAKEANEDVGLLEASLDLIRQTAAKLKGKLVLADPKTSEEFDKQAEGVSAANILIKERLKLDKQLAVAQAQLSSTTKEQRLEIQKAKLASSELNKEARELARAQLKLTGSTSDQREELAKTRLEQSRLNKEAKQSAEIQDKATGAYRKAALELAKVKRELKDASVASDKTEKEIDELKAEFNRLNKAVREADQSVGDFGRNVGNYGDRAQGFGDSIGKVGESLGGLAKGSGGAGNAITGVIGKLGPWGVAAAAAVGGAIALGDAIIDIDRKFDNLRGTIEQLTGAEGDELNRLTASLEAFNKTFEADINESLRATNVLMKEFGLNGDEATELIRQGFLSNANIQGDLLEGITEYSTQIKAAGGDADDLFKILDASGEAGVFSDKGIDTVKEFGLAIREQTQITTDALINGFGKEFTDTLFAGINDGSISTVEALQTVTNALKDTNLSAQARQTIIADVFKGAGEDAGSFLETLTEINFETEFNADLSGDLAKKKQKEFEANEKLAAAQNKLSIAIGDSSSISRVWVNIQTFLIEKLTSVVEWISYVVDAFELLEEDPIQAMKMLGQAVIEFALYPLNLFIDSLNWVLGLFSEWEVPNLGFPTDDLNEWTEAQERHISVSARAQKAIKILGGAVRTEMGVFQKRINLIQSGNLTDEKRIELTKELNENYPELLKNYDLENLSKEEAIELSNELQRQLIEEEITRNKLIATQRINSEIAKRRAKIAEGVTDGARKQLEQEIKFIDENARAQVDAIETEVRIRLGLIERIDEETEALEDLNETVDNGLGGSGKAKKALEEYTVAVATATEQFNRLAKAQTTSIGIKLNKEKFDTELEELAASYKATINQLNVNLQASILLGEVTGLPDSEMHGKALDELIALNDAHIKNLIELDQTQTNEFLKAVKTREQIQKESLNNLMKQQSDFEKDIELGLKNGGLTQGEIDLELTKLRISNLEVLRDKQIEYGEDTTEIDLKLLKQQQNYTKQRLKLLSDNQQEERDATELHLLHQGETRAEVNKMLNELDIKFLEERITLRKELGEQTLDLELELARLQEKALKDVENKGIEAVKEAADKRIEIVEAATDRILELADRRIEKIDEEIDAAQRQADYFADLAANGNIEAEQSLAEQNQIIAEAESEKQRIERQKQAIELVSSVIVAYNNALGDGKSAPEALAEAFTGTATIQAFIGTLPTFLEGIEDTGAQGFGIDGLGGFHAVLHPNERVMTKEQNQMIGDYSNEQVADIVYNHRIGGMPSEYVQSNTVDLSPLKMELQEVKAAILGKPELDIKIGEISSMAMSISESRTAGNETTTNKFIVK